MDGGGGSSGGEVVVGVVVVVVVVVVVGYWWWRSGSAVAGDRNVQLTFMATLLGKDQVKLSELN